MTFPPLYHQTRSGFCHLKGYQPHNPTLLKSILATQTLSWLHCLEGFECPRGVKVFLEPITQLKSDGKVEFVNTWGVFWVFPISNIEVFIIWQNFAPRFVRTGCLVGAGALSSSSLLSDVSPNLCVRGMGWSGVPSWWTKASESVMGRMLVWPGSRIGGFLLGFSSRSLNYRQGWIQCTKAGTGGLGMSGIGRERREIVKHT